METGEQQRWIDLCCKAIICRNYKIIGGRGQQAQKPSCQEPGGCPAKWWRVGTMTNVPQGNKHEAQTANGLCGAQVADMKLLPERRAWTSAFSKQILHSSIFQTQAWSSDPGSRLYISSERNVFWGLDDQLRKCKWYHQNQGNAVNFIILESAPSSKYFLKDIGKSPRIIRGNVWNCEPSAFSSSWNSSTREACISSQTLAVVKICQNYFDIIPIKR